jgi:hypothetical protein
MTVLLAQAAKTSWETAGMELPGILVVWAFLVLGLGRVMVAALWPDRQHRFLEYGLNCLVYPLALLAVGVVVLRFAELAH